MHGDALNRAPAANQRRSQRLRSVCGGKKNEQRREREIAAVGCECSEACEDVMQEQGVSKILTINLNDMAKELKI